MLDVLVYPASPLARGSDVRGEIRFASGGSAANVAVWAARLGARVRFLGAVGDDFIGGHLRADLEAEGVDCSGVARLPGRSPSVLALVSGDGERTMVTDRRVTLRFDAGHVSAALLTGVAHLHLTAYSLFDPGPASAAWAAAGLARAGGARVSVDLSSAALITAHGAERTREEIARLEPDVLFGNAEECRALSGAADLDAAVSRLVSLAGTVVVKRGREGCLLAEGSERIDICTRAVGPVDTVGAGDAFDAAWLCAWLGGADPEAACRAANALAARVVRLPGARGVGGKP